MPKVLKIINRTGRMELKDFFNYKFLSPKLHFYTKKALEEKAKNFIIEYNKIYFEKDQKSSCILETLN